MMRKGCNVYKHKMSSQNNKERPVAHYKKLFIENVMQKTF